MKVPQKMICRSKLRVIDIIINCFGIFLPDNGIDRIAYLFKKSYKETGKLLMENLIR